MAIEMTRLGQAAPLESVRERSVRPSPAESVPEPKPTTLRPNANVLGWPCLVELPRSGHWDR